MMGRHRKAIAASSGVLLIALLEYAVTTPDLERALELVVPHGLVPLVPVLFGGLATVAAVWRASNAQQSAAPDSVGAAPVASCNPVDARVEVTPDRSGFDARQAPMPAPAPLSPQAVSLTASVGAGAPILDPPAPAAPFRPSASSPATSLVQLLPPPAPDFH